MSGRYFLGYWVLHLSELFSSKSFLDNGVVMKMVLKVLKCEEYQKFFYAKSYFLDLRERDIL